MTGAHRLPSHPHKLLPWYAAGTLAPDERAAVEAHLGACSACAAELAEWGTLADAVQRETNALAPPLALDASWEQLSARLSSAPSTQRSAVYANARELGAWLTQFCTHSWRLLVGQVRLLPRSVWLASALGVLVALVCALALPNVGGASVALAVTLPLVASSGAVFLVSPENTPALELAQATPTSPRAALVSRFALLTGFDAALSFAVTLALASARGVSVWSLALLWLAPMALLSALSLLLALLAGAPSTFFVAACWLAGSLHFDNGFALRFPPEQLARWSPALLLLALALLALALWRVPHRTRLLTWDA